LTLTLQSIASLRADHLKIAQIALAHFDTPMPEEPLKVVALIEVGVLAIVSEWPSV
jgi:hypothetical protein